LQVQKVLQRCRHPRYVVQYRRHVDVSASEFSRILACALAPLALACKYLNVAVQEVLVKGGAFGGLLHSRQYGDWGLLFGKGASWCN
jgi:hypothetical protein